MRRFAFLPALGLTVLAQSAFAAGGGGHEEASFTPVIFQGLNLLILLGIIVHYAKAPLRRSLADQGFPEAKVTVHDTRATASTEAGTPRDGARAGDERRQGDPQRRSTQGRDSRPDGDAEGGRRSPRDERRSE